MFLQEMQNTVRHKKINLSFTSLLITLNSEDKLEYEAIK